MAGDRTGHPHETAGRRGELRSSAPKPRVEQCGQVVERILRRAVCSEHDVLGGRDFVDEAAVIGLSAHDIHVRI